MAQFTDKEFEKILAYSFASHNFKQPLVQRLLNRSVEHVRTGVFKIDYSIKNIIIINSPNYKNIPKAMSHITMHEKNVIVELINGLIDGAINYTPTLETFTLCNRRYNRSVIADIVNRFVNRSMTYDAFCSQLNTKGLPNRAIRSNLYVEKADGRIFKIRKTVKPGQLKVEKKAEQILETFKKEDVFETHAKGLQKLIETLEVKPESRFNKMTIIKDKKTGKMYQPTTLNLNTDEPAELIVNGIKGIFINDIFHKEVI